MNTYSLTRNSTLLKLLSSYPLTSLALTCHFKKTHQIREIYLSLSTNKSDRTLGKSITWNGVASSNSC